MILIYLLGKEFTQNQVDCKIRRMNIFTSPRDLIRLAQEYGIPAQAYNHSDLEEIRTHIQAGRPVQALIRSKMGLHYILVSGLEDHANVGECLIYLDPATGTRKFIPWAVFLKSWADLPALFNNFIIAYSNEPSDLPPGRVDDVALTMKVLDGVTQASNSLHALVFPDSARSWIVSVVQLPLGLLQAILFTPLALLGIATSKVKRPNAFSRTLPV